MNPEQEQFQNTIERHILTFCAPIFFLPNRESPPSNITNNGTAGLVNTGTRHVLVTCAHVWREFERIRAENPQTELATIFADGYGRPTFLALDKLIDIDDDLDLAVLAAYPERWNLGDKKFYNVTQWPIPSAQAGEVVVFLGFAGSSRMMGANFGLFPYSFFGLHVTDVSPRRILLANDRGARTLLGRDGTPIPPMRMGGLSGSPAYRFTESGFYLTGFVQMGNDSDGNIFLTNACILQQDGTIRR